MLTYHWKHIPTGNEGTGEFSGDSFQYGSTNAWLRVQALELINNWNRTSICLQNGAWLYWMD